MNREEMLSRLEAGEDPLEVSILKWKDIVEGKDLEKGSNATNCALCETCIGCKGCPIFLKTGLEGCDNTPYDKYAKLEDEEEERDVSDEEYIEVAKEELKFLISLRKKKGDK